MRGWAQSLVIAASFARCVDIVHAQCLGLQRLDAAQSFGESDEYEHNADCQWRLACPSGNTVRLVFSSFHVENNFDYVNVYDGPSDSDSWLGLYT